MVARVVEVAEDGRHLRMERGFLVVEAGGAELGRVPLDDVAALVANAHGITYSNNVLLALTQRGTPTVLCGPNHSPAAIVWPVEGHHTQVARIRAQLAAPRPLEKRLWQSIVRAKIEQQGAVLGALGRPNGAFNTLARQVRSGDPDNLEAQAARRYWPLLMGTSFRRDPETPGPNGLLNYGYAILRSGVARAVMGAGLHPSIGIHHRNRGNAMCLADDLMEPFRPVVDLLVRRLIDAGTEEVTVDAKRRLAGLLALDLRTDNGTTPLATALERLAQSIAQSFEAGEPSIDLPQAFMPLEAPA